MTKTAPPSTYFPSIDILRGFAAISIVVYHVIEHFGWKTFPSTGLLSWFRIGWMSVDLFFVISGFVIGLSAFAEIDRHGPSAFRWPFMRRRICRIAPLYYLTCLTYIIFIARDLISGDLWANALAHLLFIHNWFPQLHGAINGVNWSLGAEMQFYVLMLFIAPWLRVARWWQFTLVLMATAWLWRYGVTLLLPTSGTTGPFLPFVAATQIPGMLDEFLAGLLLARFVKSGHGTAFLSKIDTIIGGGGVLLTGLFLWAVLTLFWRHASFWNVPLMATCFRTLLASAFALLILVACTLTNKTWLALSSPFRYLGTISYGIYLWHLPVLLSWKKVTWLSPAQALPLILTCTILLSVTSWHFFERPLMLRFGKAHKING